MATLRLAPKSKRISVEGKTSDPPGKDDLAAIRTPSPTADLRFTGWPRAAALGEVHGVPCRTTCGPEISAQLRCATPTVHWLEYADWWNALIKEPLRAENGTACRMCRRYGSGMERRSAEPLRRTTLPVPSRFGYCTFHFSRPAENPGCMVTSRRSASAETGANVSLSYLSFSTPAGSLAATGFHSWPSL
jgi:hypothetical protein